MRWTAVSAGRAVARRAAGPVMHRLARAAGGPPPGLRRGNGHEPRDVPVVVVAVPGAREERLARLVEEVAAVQWATDAFTPVFVLDAPVLGVVRRAGYVVELARPDDLGRVVEEARFTYSATTVVVVGPETRDVLGVVLGAVGWAASRGPVDRLRSRLRALESWAGRRR